MTSSTRYAFVDVETTGLDAASNEVLEVGVVIAERAAITHRERWLVQPTRPVPRFIEALTGLGPTQRAAAQPWAEVRAAVGTRLHDTVVVAHNAAFERAYLGDAMPESVIDSCELLHLLFPERPSHALDALARWLEVPPRPRHRALEDAETTFDVVRAALAKAEATYLAELSHRLSSGPMRALMDDATWRAARLRPAYEVRADAVAALRTELASPTHNVTRHSSEQRPAPAYELRALAKEVNTSVEALVHELRAGKREVVDLEVQEVADVVAAARALSEPVLLALPSAKSARRFAAKHQLPVLPALTQLVVPRDAPVPPLANAFLWALSARLPHEAPVISRFMADRHPTLTECATSCTKPRTVPPVEGVMVTTHERAQQEPVLTAFIDAPFVTPLPVQRGVRCRRAVAPGVTVRRFETRDALMAALNDAPTSTLVMGTDLEPAFACFPNATLLDSRRLLVGEGPPRVTVLLDAVDEESLRWEQSALGPDQTLWALLLLPA